MSQYKDCSRVQIRWIHIYLYLLQQIKATHYEFDFNDISLESLKKSSRNLLVKQKALHLIEKIRTHKKITKSDFIFSKLIKDSLGLNFKKIEIIKSTFRFEEVIDSDFLEGICDDEHKIIHKLNSGLRIIESISNKWHNNMTDVLENISGIIDERNIINSGFTKDFPGFINLNINADSVIIGEQLAHETTHLLFENLLYFKKNIKKYVRELPPIFSIFAKKPRSTELVLHGLFSYTSVYLYWDSLLKVQPSEAKRVEKRKKQVLSYIQEAINDLNNVLNTRDWNRVIKIFKSLCPIFNENVWITRAAPNFKVDNLIIKKLSKYLNVIEIAEILLAIEGNKVSRISVPLNIVNDLIKIIHCLPVHYCFSNYIFSSNIDKKINDFQNVISSIYNLDTYLNEDIDIHIYFSNKQNTLKKSYILDQTDNSATLFKTPKCCQEFFAKKWEYSVKKYQGDLSRVYFEKSKKNIVIENLLYNPIPMYYGLGFCWHFPCSLTCKNTIKVINKRIQVLNKYPFIKDKLLLVIKYKLIFKNINSYKLITK